MGRSTRRAVLTAAVLAALVVGCGEQVETSAKPLQAAQPGTDGPDVGQKIPAYRNTIRRFGAAEGTAEPFDTRATVRPTVYIVNSTRCPYSGKYVGPIKEFEKQYMARGVDVVHVYPRRKESVAEKQSYHATKGFAGGIVIDQEAEFARNLEITKAPTAILTDAKGTILYRGRIEDAQKASSKVKVRDLVNAVDAHLAGRPVTVARTEPFG